MLRATDAPDLTETSIEVVGEPKRSLSVFVKGYTEMPVILHPR